MIPPNFATTHWTLNTGHQLFMLRNAVGFLLQFAALVFLPLLIIWQLNFGFRLLWMPSLTIVGVIVFWIGHLLRSKVK